MTAPSRPQMENVFSDEAARRARQRNVFDPELLRLVEELPEEEVPAVLDDVRRHLRSVRERPWPPAWFGAGEGSADDVAARSEDLLMDGFGHSA